MDNRRAVLDGGIEEDSVLALSLSIIRTFKRLSIAVFKIKRILKKFTTIRGADNDDNDSVLED